MESKIFSKRLSKLRKDKGISMEQLAECLNSLNTNIKVTKSAVNMWENSSSIPKSDILITISEFFNVSIDYLLGNETKEGLKPSNIKLAYLQRNLEKLDNEKLEKAENVLKTIFDDIFDDDEGE